MFPPSSSSAVPICSGVPSSTTWALTAGKGSPSCRCSPTSCWRWRRPALTAACCRTPRARDSGLPADPLGGRLGPLAERRRPAHPDLEWANVHRLQSGDRSRAPRPGHHPDPPLTGARPAAKRRAGATGRTDRPLRQPLLAGVAQPQPGQSQGAGVCGMVAGGGRWLFSWLACGDCTINV